MLALASSSPRRRKILEKFFGKVLVIPSGIDEDLNGNPKEIVLLNAKKKAEKVLHKVNPGDIVVAADTVVVSKGNILGKPRSIEEARNMLLHLSGKKHYVFTGYVILKEDLKLAGVVKTEVKFRNLPSWLVEWYVSRGEPLDKAGAYGIQGLGGILVESIQGDFYNVAGFPMEAVLAIMELLRGTG